MNEEAENISTPTPLSDQKDLSNPQSLRKPKIKFSLVEKWKEIMNSIKEKTGIDGIYLIIFLSICVLLVYLGIFGALITSLVGTLYPGFSTIKAIQKNKNKKDWLTYWVIFGSFLIFDMFSNIIVKFIPFYFVLKILFLIWMFIPGSNGCKLVYEFLISRVMKPLEQLFDWIFEEYVEAKRDILNKAKQEGVKIMNNVMNFNKKMQNRKANLAKKENNFSRNDINNISKSGIDLNPSFNMEKKANEEKKEEEKKVEKNEEERVKEEHINLNKNIDEFRSSFSNGPKEQNNDKENPALELSFEEENDDKNKK